MADSAASFIMNGKDRSWAFILAEQGYNVWLPNLRGNKYSRGHSTLDPNGFAYWDGMLPFTTAKYDISAVIEFVKDLTGADKITLVAHSQATQMMFYNLITNSTYFGDNVNLLITTGPLAQGTLLSQTNKF